MKSKRSLRPLVAGPAAEQTYVNDLSADDGNLIRWAYGPNWDRLVDIKRRYDPAFGFTREHFPPQPKPALQRV
jgi:Berberine and berberine like